MSAYQSGGCQTPSYGSYNPCSNCGVNAARSTWNSMDPCLQNSCCQTASLPTAYTPNGRCDYRERASRNIYDWKKSFSYGTVDDSINYGSDGAGCIFMGSITDTNASFPWGLQGSTFKDASYASYTGNLDKDRKQPYAVYPNTCGYDVDIKTPAQACGNPNSTAIRPLMKGSQYGVMNINFVPYESL